MPFISIGIFIAIGVCYLVFWFCWWFCPILNPAGGLSLSESLL
jgi:hypothetical protein